MGHPLEPDPFSLVYDSVFLALQNSPSVAVHVTEANLVRVDDLLTPLIDSRMIADLAAMVLFPTVGGENNLFNTNTNAMFQQGYTLQFLSGHELTDTVLNPLKFAIMRALFTAGVKLRNIGVTKWDIQSWTPIQPDQTIIFAAFEIDEEQGWAAELNLMVDIRIDHDELLET